MRVCLLKSHNTSVFVHSRPSSYVLVRECMSPSVPDTCVFVRVHASAFVYIRVIKSPDASARIISDASGRIFRSRTFETHYMFFFSFIIFPYFLSLLSSFLPLFQRLKRWTCLPLEVWKRLPNAHLVCVCLSGRPL